MNFKSQTQRLIQSYEGKVAWGDGDHDEALQDAVKAAFPNLQEDGQAELYTQIAEAWEGYRDGMVPRRLWIGTLINRFMSNRSGSAAGELKIFTNIPKKEAE
jgi:hypothetical protein